METNKKTQKSKPRKSRSIPQGTKVLLAARSAGRCEFAGCNRYLFEHPLTLKDGNFSEHAHIIAFSELGPRGREEISAEELNSADNLMLLCAACHKLIDDRPEEYSRSLLEAYKQEHEDRVKLVSGAGPDLRTTIVQLKAKIGGAAVDIPASDVYEAVAPRYPTDKRGEVIDLNGLGHEDVNEYYEIATREIRRKVQALYEPGMDVERTRHISLFALAPIPLLVLLGRSLSNKVAVDFYQRHRTGDQPWKWKTSGIPAEYEVRTLREGKDPRNVGLVLSLSGPINPHTISLNKQCGLYEIRLASEEPNVHFLRQRADMEAFRIAYRNFLATLIKSHPDVSELHVFPAIPAPIAIALGHDVLPKVHPSLLIYDFDKNHRGFTKRLTVN